MIKDVFCSETVTPKPISPASSEGKLGGRKKKGETKKKKKGGKKKREKKELQVKQGSLKPVLIAKIFLRFMLEYGAGVRDLSKELSPVPLKSFEYFKDHTSPTLINQDMPTVDHLNKIAETTGKILAVTPHPTLLLPSNRTLSDVTESMRTSSTCSRGREQESRELGTKRRSTIAAPTRNVRRKNPTEDKNVIVSSAEPDEGVAEFPNASDGKHGQTVSQKEGNECLLDVGEDTGTRGLSLSEFARLLLVLRDDEACRIAFIDSSQPLSRQELDRGDKRNQFWTTLVEPVFNDSATTFDFDCSSVIPHVGPPLAPGKRRTAQELENAFKSFRTKLTVHLKRHLSSGQNGRDWKLFLICGGVKESSALGKRLILAGAILGIGSFKEHEIIDCINRTIGPAGKDGYEAPLSQNGGEVYVRQPMSRSRKQPRVTGNDVNVETLGLITTIEDCVTQVKEGVLSKDKFNSQASVVTASRVPTLQGRGAAQLSDASPAHSSRRDGFDGSIGSTDPEDHLEMKRLLNEELMILSTLHEAREGKRKAVKDEWMKKKFDEVFQRGLKEYEELKKTIESIEGEGAGR